MGLCRRGEQWVMSGQRDRWVRLGSVIPKHISQSDLPTTCGRAYRCHAVAHSGDDGFAGKWTLGLNRQLMAALEAGSRTGAVGSAGEVLYDGRSDRHNPAVGTAVGAPQPFADPEYLASIRNEGPLELRMKTPCFVGQIGWLLVSVLRWVTSKAMRNDLVTSHINLPQNVLL